MRTVRLARWSGSVLSPRTRPNLARVQTIRPLRFQSTAVAAQEEPETELEASERKIKRRHTRYFDSPPPSAALASSKLHALHARLQLPERLPIQSLARCLVHSSADPDKLFNNSSLEILGRDLLGYYTSELILCTYPRLPMDLVYAATKAYVGPAASGAIAKEWGVEAVAKPGGEVDPGLLQFQRVEAGNADVRGVGVLLKDVKKRKGETAPVPTLSAASIADTYFGPLDMAERPEFAEEQRNLERLGRAVSLEEASMSFLRALFGALYLHAGRTTAKSFFNQHIRSRKLDVSRMFYFEQPTRDLSRLCAREGFEPPVARIISETGRDSRHPVFVIGVFSGREKLGEGAGGSLDEARIRAAIAALKGWYLYSPVKLNVPSDVEGNEGAAWEPAYISGGEVIV